MIMCHSNTAAPSVSVTLFLAVVLFNLQNLPESSKVIAGSNKCQLSY